ncbi:MAG: substrate-binding domain-containing protein [Planctomycetes bacterium]|nr:substrate-binding domain-containing protein [Planctomycetota bacterium]
MRRLCLVIAIQIAFAAGCGRTDQGVQGSNEQPGEKKELLIFVGAGIRPPVAELAEVFDSDNNVEVVPDYAGSELLISKIKLAEIGDIYMPGDKHYVDQAAEAGMIFSQRSICYFVPTILVQKGNPKGITGLADLVKPGIKLGLGDEKACAIGRKCKKIFSKNNIPWEDVERNLKYQSMTVNELGIQIQAQSLDAVIVWDAVAGYYAEHGDEVPIPKEKNVISTVDAGVLKFTKNRKLAEKFVELACSERGREIFKRHNYRVAPPE